MQKKTIEPMLMVEGIVFDRCGVEAKRGDAGFKEMVFIAFDACNGLGLGNSGRVMVDLCQPR